jgi:hypothetical protein
MKQQEMDMQNFKAVGSFRDKRRSFVYYSAENGPACKLTIRYDDGGYSFVDYKNKPRGIRLNVTVVSRSTTATGVSCEQYAPLDDCNFFVMLEETKRYNDRRLETVAGAWDEFAPELANLYMVDRPAALDKLRAMLGMKEAA